MTILVIPEILRSWPWPRKINLHYQTCKTESSSWCESFQAFSPNAQEAFNKCDFGLLASLAYPFHDQDGCRIGCDLMNLLFVIDEHTDVADVHTASVQKDVLMDALRNPERPRSAGEWVGGKIARQFWLNAIRRATLCSRRRFIDSFQKYMEAVVQEVIDRSNNHIHDVETYLKARRNTSGAGPSFAISELYLNIPDPVIDHPVIAKLTELCIDMLIIGNDLYSYKVEHARGDDKHNFITVVMNQFHWDSQRAIDYISGVHDERVEQFMKEWQHIPTFGGPIDREVRTYCDALGNWVRANDSWSLETSRYSGDQGFIIQATKQVQSDDPSGSDAHDAPVMVPRTSSIMKAKL